MRLLLLDGDVFALVAAAAAQRDLSYPDGHVVRWSDEGEAIGILNDLVEKVMAKLGARPEPETGKGLAAGKVAQDRKQAQVEKNVDTAKRQPASMKETGIDSDKAGVTAKVDYTKLTAEEREALPAATRARLRGDDLE